MDYKNQATLSIGLFFASTCGLGLTANNAVAGNFYAGVGIGVSQYDDIADTGSPQFLSGLPSEFPINGLLFDSTETAWSLRFGWQARSWLAFELGHSDLGTSGPDLGASFATAIPVDINIAGASLSPVSFGPAPLSSLASLTAEQWHLGTKFYAQLHGKFSGHWYLGVARTTFDVGGSLPVIAAFSPGPGFMVVRFPFAKPANETGINWGFGFDWDLNERVTLDLAWRRHQTGVLDIDKLELGVVSKF